MENLRRRTDAWLQKELDKTNAEIIKNIGFWNLRRLQRRKARILTILRERGIKL